MRRLKPHKFVRRLEVHSIIFSLGHEFVSIYKLHFGCIKKIILGSLDSIALIIIVFFFLLKDVLEFWCLWPFWCLAQAHIRTCGQALPGRALRYAGGHFGARASVWAHGQTFWRPAHVRARGRAFWRLGARLGTRAGIFGA